MLSSNSILGRIALILSILLLLFRYDSIAQIIPRDSLIKLANEYYGKCFQAAFRDLDKAKIYADSSLLLFQQAGDTYGEKRYNYLLGVMERTRGNPSKAEHYFRTFLADAHEEKDTMMIGDASFQLAVVLHDQGSLDSSIVAAYHSLDQYRSLNRDELGQPIFNLLGIIYKKLKQYDQALKMYQESIQLAAQKEDLDGQATAYVNMGNVYGLLNQFEQAVQAYKAAIRCDSLNRFDYGLGYDYESLGNLYARSDEHEKALVYLKRSLSLRKAMGSLREAAISHQKIGASLTDLGNFTKAFAHLDTAGRLADTVGALELKAQVTQSMAKLAFRSGDHKNAFLLQETYTILKDSLLNQSITQQINELNTKYETEKKEKAIQLLNAENALKSAQLSASRRQFWGMLIGSVLIAGLAFFLFRLYQKSQYQKATIKKALEEKEILLREIHHRVKNNLQFISSLLNLQAEHVEDKNALSALNEGQARVQSMALIHQNLYQEDNLTGVEIKTYFVKLIRHLFDSYNIRSEQISLDLKVDDLNLDVDTVIPVGLIINELVSNCLKYAFPGQQKGQVRVELRDNDDHLSLRVEDNGIGMTKEQMSNLGDSFGYRLIHVFSNQLQAETKIEGTGGTSVYMRIRKFQKLQ